MTSRDITSYRALPYKHVWETREEDGRRSFVVRLAEIPCVVGGDASKDDALRALRAAFDDYIEWRLEEDLPIALPNRVLAREGAERLTVVVEPAVLPEPALKPLGVTIDAARETRATQDTRVYQYPQLQSAAA